MKSFAKLYLSAYKGLSTPIWMLALVMLVNRTGAMVIPFLGIYMVKELGFTLQQSGVVLSLFGVGAVIGSFVGGKLTDKIGSFKIQLCSLLCCVPLFLILPNLQTPTSLAIGVFILSVVADTFRPANSVAIIKYAKSENVVRSFTLNRMALNLGFSIGPALGGFLAAISYSLLFYGNATAALLSAMVFYLYFNNKAGNKPSKEENIENKVAYTSPYKDVPFLIFSGLSVLFAICFFQLLTTLPLYYRSEYGLNEKSIGIILAFSGVVVFSLEMLLVHIAERRTTPIKAIIYGVLFCGISFGMLLITKSVLSLYISMFMLCVSEILAMPFMATVTMQRSNKSNRGAYMGLNSLTLSAGLIFAPFVGTKIAGAYGYNTLWVVMLVVMFLTALGLYILQDKLKVNTNNI